LNGTIAGYTVTVVLVIIACSCSALLVPFCRLTIYVNENVHLLVHLKGIGNAFAAYLVGLLRILEHLCQIVLLYEHFSKAGHALSPTVLTALSVTMIKSHSVLSTRARSVSYLTSYQSIGRSVAKQTQTATRRNAPLA